MATRALDTHSDVLIPEPLRRELLHERDRERLRELLHTSEAQPCAKPGASAAPPALALTSATPTRGRNGLPLYDPALAAAALAALLSAGRANERQSQARALLSRLTDSDAMRRIARPGRGMRARLQQLRQAFPNFAEVLDAVERAIALARCAGEPLVLPPMLLVGGPGVGKSLFVEQLCLQLMGLRVCRVQVETSGIADTLIGTERHWSTCGPGAIFNLLVGGEFINPWVMLDELDKAPQRREHAGLAKVLYALLERDSARRFTDQALPEVPLDASHLSWMATANRTDTIDRPLLDRLQVFHIPAPTAEQARAIVTRMDADLRRQRGLSRLPPLPPDLTEQISQLAPRRAGKLLRVLLGSLAARKADAFGPPECELVQAELKRAAAQARAQPQRALTEAEWLQSVMTLSTNAALRALEITGLQWEVRRLKEGRGALH
jgi:ATP-dependent Lon protease